MVGGCVWQTWKVFHFYKNRKDLRVPSIPVTRVKNLNQRKSTKNHYRSTSTPSKCIEYKKNVLIMRLIVEHTNY